MHWIKVMKTEKQLSDFLLLFLWYVVW